VTLLFFDEHVLIFIFGAELNASLWRVLGDETRGMR
jgi:hypothetical protein